jgi:hypothetical protein
MAEKYDRIQFCFKLRSSASKLHEIFKTVPWRQHTTQNGFLESNSGKLWSKIVSVQVIPPHVAQKKRWRRFTSSSTKTSEVLFWRLLANRTSFVEHVNKF